MWVTKVFRDRRDMSDEDEDRITRPISAKEIKKYRIRTQGRREMKGRNSGCDFPVPAAVTYRNHLASANI